MRLLSRRGSHAEVRKLPAPALDGEPRHIGCIAETPGGKRYLIVELGPETKVPPHIEVGDRTYQLVERSTPPSDRQFGIIYRALARITDKMLEKWGLRLATKLAKLDSKIDIVSSYILLGAAAIFGVVGALALGFPTQAQDIPVKDLPRWMQIYWERQEWSLWQ